MIYLCSYLVASICWITYLAWRDRPEACVDLDDVLGAVLWPAALLLCGVILLAQVSIRLRRRLGKRGE